jgi:peroxiredoxin
MRTSTRSTRVAPALLLGALLLTGAAALSGCGGGQSAPSGHDSPGSQSGQAKSAELPTAAIGGDAAQASNKDASPAPLPKEGSPEWLIGQMIVLRNERLQAKTPQERDAQNRERNEKLVKLAYEVISKTHNDKSKESTFDSAVHFLVESRLQLAIAGSAADAKSLQNDAQDLYQRDPQSNTAAEAAFAVVRLAHTHAQLNAKSQPRSLQNFAIQAKLFASRFPKHEARAVQILFAAGRTCEMHGLAADGLSCYAMLVEKYPQSPQAQQAAAIIRRLQLRGKPLQLGGETADGGFVKIEQFKGRPVLVVFWSSDSEPFQEMVPKLRQALPRYEKLGLAVIGVCLDENETSMDAFMEKSGLSWTQIFYADQSKRQWDHPLVRYYGVQSVPTLWLVDRNGSVVDTELTLESLDGQLRELLAGGAGANERR